mgnify:CR=1 FL=1
MVKVDGREFTDTLQNHVRTLKTSPLLKQESHRITAIQKNNDGELVRPPGFEPGSSAWKAGILVP